MPQRTACEWFKFIFWQGQELEPAEQDAIKTLNVEMKTMSRSKRLLIKHRRLIGFLIPASIFHFFWWSAMIKNNAWYLFVDNYFMTLTMVFGSMIAGMTSVGGGAIAFPAMTLAFSLTPSVARDFSVLIQSCGMSAASFTIVFMRIVCEWRVLGICSFGGVFGLIVGLEFLDPLISETNKKLGYVSIWFAFAFVLLFLVIFKKGGTCLTIKKWNVWRVMIFLITGFCGGICTALAGNGIDICTFSVLTLVFRVNEKVATPTTVILMAGNSLCCIIWRGAISMLIDAQAWNFLAVCMPIVVLGAPLGSILGSHFHRVVLASLVIVLDVIGLVSAYIIIPMSVSVGLAMGGIIVGGVGFFALLAYAGHRIHRNDSTEGQPQIINEDAKKKSSIEQELLA